MKIILVGNGQMGRAIAAIIAETPQHQILAALSSKDVLQPDMLANADALIDFTNAKAFLQNLPVLLAANRPIVVGTTGWYHHLSEVKAQVEGADGALLYAANFSLGVHLFLRLAKVAASLIAPFPEFDIAISEAHHTRKKDAPSGTALKAAEQVLAALPRKTALRTALLPDTPLQKEELLITSLRVGSVFGEHTLHIDSPADELVIRHTAKSRRGFAEGALQAAEWLQGKRGFFSFEDFLSEKLGF
ncbi:MAG: 4-hydroxy-tetrahydrodipicolinate reductase [Chloroherpetonaceae bacterium]|nr:4-hydroxy-tetrahydrodipicolinate reductase [Chloroherpetonaceae bacterium]MCS7210556.1 4-hydroxy-tetrahydrodipicolinate reductase [Chloroherpetonaceae bacterium]MDW8019448.1 4-hydroxy-tetrahydrodipicolinate reductase [Chloroherpetonaceae bacterium]